MPGDKCRICGNEANHSYYNVNERMLGMLDEFEYFQCKQCNCLQIREIPDNLSDYYPDNYYSYKSLSRLIKSPLRQWVDTHRVNQSMEHSDLPGLLLNAISKPLEYIPWIQQTSLSKDAKILDIGCGQGRLLLRMALGGFTNLTGIDPFIKQGITYQNGVKILKSDLDDFTKMHHQFDFIMLHHSLEHMPDQQASMKSIRDLLSPNGIALIRIPLADSYAWEHYKEYWVQLDAPRHLYLHSKASLGLLARQHDLVIDKTVYDSARFQFTGSELYRRGIALASDKKTRDIFSKEQLDEYDNMAKQLNNSQDGDQAVFYLKLSSH